MGGPGAAGRPRRRGRWRGDGEVAAWLWGIAARRLVSRLRGHREALVLPLEDVAAARPAEPSAEEKVLLGVEYGDLGAALLRLSPQMRAAAFVLDEPAGNAVDAVPATRRRRTAARATAVVLPFVVWAGSVLALEQRNAATRVGGLLVEGAGVLAVALALAAVLRLTGRHEPGEIVSSVLGAGLLGVLIFNPPPRSVPLFPIDEGWVASTALWSSLAVAAVTLVIAASRDPCGR